MTKTVPVSFSRNDGKSDSTPSGTDQMIEHQRTAKLSELEENSVLNEGSDSGTKGTGSAG